MCRHCAELRANFARLNVYNREECAQGQIINNTQGHDMTTTDTIDSHQESNIRYLTRLNSYRTKDGGYRQTMASALYAVASTHGHSDAVYAIVRDERAKLDAQV